MSSTANEVTSAQKKLEFVKKSVAEMSDEDKSIWYVRIWDDMILESNDKALALYYETLELLGQEKEEQKEQGENDSDDEDYSEDYSEEMDREQEKREAEVETNLWLADGGYQELIRRANHT